MDACAECSAGEYSEAYNMEECTACEANTISVAGAASCTSCEEGTVANTDHTECGGFTVHFQIFS